jgi:hypothetical protein
LRKNGVPYSRDTVLTEYFDLTTAPSGETWLVITTIVDDPAYLRRTWVTSPNFRKEADDRGFMPSECSSTW